MSPPPGVDMELERWTDQEARWPQQGRHILAHHDDESVIVYQAYRHEIADWAVAHQQFGGPWSFERMSWIKPNFLWMMYRCGWATKPGQERVLAVRLARAGFEQVLERAHISKAPEGHTVESWRAVLRGSDVRLQWDPDHAPGGEKLERRAIQLGLRGATLRSYATEWCLEIADLTDFVAQQRERMRELGRDALVCPRERVYWPDSELARRNVGLDAPPG